MSLIFSARISSTRTHFVSMRLGYYNGAVDSQSPDIQFHKHKAKEPERETSDRQNPYQLATQLRIL